MFLLAAYLSDSMPDYTPKAVSSSRGGFTRARVPFSTGKADQALDTVEAQQILRKALSAQEKALARKPKGARRSNVLEDSWEKFQDRLTNELERVIEEGAAKVGGSVDARAMALERAAKIMEDFDQITVKRLMADKDPFGDADRRAQVLGSAEVQSAYHEGMLAAAIDQGGKVKRWKTYPGCCEECARLHGTTRDLEDGWETKFGFIRVPPVHPNCKCSVEFVAPQVRRAK